MSKPLDRYLDDYGRSLRARAADTPTRRRAVALRLGVATGAASLVAGVLLLAGAFSTRSVDAVAEARAALEPKGNEVVHLRIAWTADASAGVGLPRPRRLVTEQWTAGDPPRWREVETYVERGRTVRREYAFGGGAVSTYDPQRGRLRIREGLSTRGLAARPPGPFGNDPDTALSGLLRSDRVADLGVIRARNREVRRLRVVHATGGDRVRTVLTYDVDPQTFAPVGGEVRKTLAASDRRIDLVRRFVVDSYRRIPLTARASKLLEIDPRPGTKVTRLSAAQAAAEQRRLRPRRTR